MLIGGIQKLSLIDFPGRISCTVFFLGCNFRCPFCYNPELVLPDPHLFKKGGGAEKDFFDFLGERRGLVEGVVLCGGEPTISEDLPEFCQRIKKMGYSVKLDTNGSNPEMLKKLFSNNLLDYAAMDIKAPMGPKTQNSWTRPGRGLPGGLQTKNQNYNLKLKSKYEEVVGVKVNLEDIKKSIELIKNSGIDYEFRTTVVPGLHTKQDIVQIARQLSPAKKYFLQNFQPGKTIDPRFEKIKPYSNEEMLEIHKAVAPFFEVCQIRPSSI